MKLPTQSLARIDDAVIARRVADTLRQELRSAEARADWHFDHCRSLCRAGLPCERYDRNERELVDIQRRLRHVAG